jgi:hypothetical protein
MHGELPRGHLDGAILSRLRLSGEFSAAKPQVARPY